MILAQPTLIALIALPILFIQSYAIFALGYAWAWAWRLPHPIAAPCAMIGTSNFFELAVAVAIGLFGLNSGRGAGYRGWRAGRGAGDAVPGGFCQPHARAFRSVVTDVGKRGPETANPRSPSMNKPNACCARCGAAQFASLTPMSDDAHRRTVRDAYAQVAQASDKGQKQRQRLQLLRRQRR